MYYIRTIKYMAIICCFFAFSSANCQEIYRCKSPKGTIFSDNPCGVSAERLEYKTDSNLKTPSNRLIGHWTTRSNDSLYYSPVKAGGRGRYILLQGSGRIYEHNYRIIAEDITNNSLEIELLFADGDKRKETCVFSEDGKTMTTFTLLSGTRISSELQFVNKKIQPDHYSVNNGRND